ncbi:MAG: polymerase factor sigma-54 [Pseudomonadota bacterium]
MAMGPRLDLRQSQSLVMTPQLQQAIKLLALSNLEIETFIGDALDANPLLELGDGAPVEAVVVEETELRRTTLESSPVDQLIGEGKAEDDRPLDVDRSALDTDRDTGDGEWGAELRFASGGEDGPGIDERADSAATLAEHLHAQIGAATRDPRQAFIARHLADQLDEAGYLPITLREVAAELGIDLDEAEAALALLQSLDPTGVGARSLGECLALQAKEADRFDPCMERLLDNLELLGKGELPRLKRMCGVDDEDFADMLSELRGYDPKPGLRFSSGGGEPVTPDILITARSDGGWDVQLNQATLPRLIVNRSYYVEMKGSLDDKEARGWLSDKLADANWLIKALDQRAKTILKVASEIAKQQDLFFRHGVSQLRQM